MDITDTTAWSIAIALAYISGSIPVGLFIGKSKGVDLRTVGSGNIGATNCGRVLGRRYGALCFMLDLLKGFAPVFAAGWWFGMIGGVARPEIAPAAEWAWLAVAAAAVVGHIFPIWLKFRGGKGVATGLGVVLGVWPHLTVPALAAAVLWGLCAAAFRYVGLASAVAAASMPCFVAIAASLRGHPISRAAPYLLVTFAMAALIVWRHRSNLRRAIQGTESRIGGPRTPEKAAEISKKFAPRR